MGKIILNLAISIDGFIADKNGGFDWIGEDGSKIKSDNEWSYEKFLENIDIIVMGKNCYIQNFHKDFKDKKVYIATSEKLEDKDNLYFTDNICEVILNESKKNNKNVFLFGGGVLVDSFLKANLIDEYIIGYIPIILGSGRLLFLDNNPNIKLMLEEYYVKGGVIIAKYKRR